MVTEQVNTNMNVICPSRNLLILPGLLNGGIILHEDGITIQIPVKLG